MIESNKTIGEIVAEDFRTAKVFEKYGIDFCCGGKVALPATCVEKKIDLATVIILYSEDSKANNNIK